MIGESPGIEGPLNSIHREENSSPSGYSVQVHRPPLTHTPSTQADYCFEEARLRETTNAQRLLGLPVDDKQSLIAKGILTKICRRKPKQRTFFLFNNALVYANISYGKLLAHPHSFKLEEVSVSDVDDSGIYRNGFIIETPKKSFTVYATIAEEKRRWVLSITQNAEASRKAAGLEGKGKLSAIQKSPVWIPNSEAAHCMVCLNTEFTLVQRRHHCRNCGKVVCAKCSQYRWVLPSQGPDKLRVCRTCHELLREEQEAKKAADHTPATPTSSLKPSDRLPVYAPPNWQQEVEERLNEDDSDSDEETDYGNGFPPSHPLTAK
uniref:FYVE-type domain-containing protein n=1 Tax=Mesocestoides corti TaxID=53468 RepID=A0A5K3EYC1_MESCO